MLTQTIVSTILLVAIIITIWRVSKAKKYSLSSFGDYLEDCHFIKRWIMIFFTAIFFIFIFILIYIILVGSYTEIYAHFVNNDSDSNTSVSTTTDSTGSNSNYYSTNSSCNIAGINLHGELVTYLPAHYFDNLSSDPDVIASESVDALIQQAIDAPNIKAIMVEVDSPGGEPVAGEEIANTLKSSIKPTVAVIRQTGASAAYWASTGANKIFASLNSDIGSIGVTASYLESVNKNKSNGLNYVQLSMGKYKDSGNPNRPMTDTEKALVMRDLKIVYNNFINTVSTNRGISVADVTKIADGSTVLGAKAKDLNLIDEIGGVPDATKYLGTTIGEKPSVCW